MANYIRTLKNFGRGLKGTSITFLGAGMTVFPQTMPIGVALTVKGINDVYKSLQGDYIKNSIMCVEPNKIMNKLQNHPENYIGQPIPTVKQYLEAKLIENKMDFLKLQEVNLLLELDTKNKDGEYIQYNTITHGINYALLKKLQNQGIISDLKKEKEKMRSLKLVKSFIGNNGEDKNYKNKRKNEIKDRVSEQKGIFNKVKTLHQELNEGLDKKNQFYTVSFKKTDKTFSEEEIANMLSFAAVDGKIDREKYNVKLDKNGNIKGINYSVKYIVQLLRQRTRERYDKTKNNIRESLSALTNGISEIVASENKAKEKNRIISERDDRMV